MYNRSIVAKIAILVVAIAFPFMVENAYYQDVLITMLLWAGLAGAWNITGGYAGLISLGHAAFFGLGAYTSTLLFLRLGVTPWLGMLVGGALAAIAALVIGTLTIRLRGPYFALATLAFGEVLLIVATHWHSLTRGSEGLRIPFQPGFANIIFYGKVPYFYLALGLVLLIYSVSRWLQSSRLGAYLVALREDEAAAQALGVDTVRLRLIAAMISAFLTALCGSLYAQYIGLLEPIYTFAHQLSIEITLGAIIGGMGTALGPILGAFAITALRIFLRAEIGSDAAGLYLVFYGFLLVIVVLFLPDGLLPWISKKLARRTTAARLERSTADASRATRNQ